jgi:hypothetical protein
MVTRSPGDAHPQIGGGVSRWSTIFEPITEGNRTSALEDPYTNPARMHHTAAEPSLQRTIFTLDTFPLQQFVMQSDPARIISSATAPRFAGRWA